MISTLNEKIRRRNWRVRTPAGSFRVVRRIDLADGQEPEKTSFLRFQISAWTRDPARLPVLMEMYEAAFGVGISHTTLTEPTWLEDRIQEAFRSGRLVLIREEQLFYKGDSKSGGGGGGGSPPAGAEGKSGGGETTKDQKKAKSSTADKTPPPTEPKKQELTWFRARLVDEDGKPVAGEDFVVMDSQGVRRQGKLDENGEIYIPEILPPGNCTIRFPNMHLNPRKRK